MKIRLKKGKQKELIFLAKKDLTWKQLAQLLDLPELYLSGDIRRENILISEKTYNKLCEIAKVNFDKFIIEELLDNWGQSQGGLNSLGSTKKLPKVEFNMTEYDCVDIIADVEQSYSMNDVYGDTSWVLNQNVEVE